MEAALAALQISLEKYRVLFESFPLGITISDDSGKIIEANIQSEKLLGIPRDGQTQKRIDGKEWRIIRTDGTPMPAGEFASVRASQEKRLIENVEMGIVKDKGEITWINVTAAPIPLEGYGVAITYNDISERKRAEEEIKRQLSEKETLLKEVHHRIKNNIASIGGLISLRMQAVADPEAMAVLKEANSRVTGMRLLYDKLLLDEGYKDISVKNYLEDLTDTIVALFPDQAKIKLDRQIADFRLDAKRLFPLGSIINELAHQHDEIRFY